MTERFTDITASKYRCTIGGCPAVYKSEDGKTLTIIGERVVSELADKAGPTEAAVEIPTDLVLASIGVRDYSPHISTAHQLVGFLKGMAQGLDDLNATEMTDDHFYRLKNALRQAQKKAESVADFLSETAK